jgi:hypothetical protein
MSEYRYRTEDLAAEFGISPKTLRKKATGLRLGINLEGRAGFRYSEADRLKLIESMRPAAPVEKRKRPRRTSSPAARGAARSESAAP